MLEELIGAELFARLTRYVCKESICELRLRENCKAVVKTKDSRIVTDVIIDEQIIKNIVSKATKYSVYAHQDELIKGYISCGGGVRIGIAGKCVTEGSKLLNIKDISSLCIRIPRRIQGVPKEVEKLAKNFVNTLVVAPPFYGKTTLIRELASLLAEKNDVAVIDERGELSAGGYFSLGIGADVMTGATKSLVYEGILRGMGADVVVMDELAPKDDDEVVARLCASGVKVLASVHGSSAEEWLEANPNFKNNFSCFITLGNKPQVGCIKSFVRIGD